MMKNRSRKKLLVNLLPLACLAALPLAIGFGGRVDKNRSTSLAAASSLPTSEAGSVPIEPTTSVIDPVVGLPPEDPEKPEKGKPEEPNEISESETDSKKSEGDEKTEMAVVEDDSEKEESKEEPEENSEEKKEEKEKTTANGEPIHEFKLVLPTENENIFEDPPAFFMHTNRYNSEGKNMRPWEAGQYGYVRNQRWTPIGVVFTRLHEGIDIRPMRRDSSNMPLDDVVSMSDGIVVHVNSSSSMSSYGRYVVVKHNWLEGTFYSLYAHLATTDVKKGDNIKAGHILGRLGYSGVGLDRERAHVHVELTFMISERFGTSYSPGYHGNHNGLNLIGLNIGRFLKEYRDNPDMTIEEFLADEEPYFTVRTANKKVPGILNRHPWMGRELEKMPEAKGWDITFSQSGVPLSFKPSLTYQKYTTVTWVKPMNTNHSYLTSGRLSGSGKTAQLSSKGYRFVNLICELF